MNTNADSPKSTQQRPSDRRAPDSRMPPRTKRRVLALSASSAVLILLGCCLMGISAAIAIPGLLEDRENAQERWRQRMAMADIRHIAECCTVFASVNHHYPLVENPEPVAFSMTTASGLKKVLASAKCCPDCPVRDPWGGEYSYGVAPDGNRFFLECYGSDGRDSTSIIPIEHLSTSCFEDDIVWLDGRFVQEPQGEQKKCSREEESPSSR